MALETGNESRSTLARRIPRDRASFHRQASIYLATGSNTGRLLQRSQPTVRVRAVPLTVLPKLRFSCFPHPPTRPRAPGVPNKGG